MFAFWRRAHFGTNASRHSRPHIQTHLHHLPHIPAHIRRVDRFLSEPFTRYWMTVSACTDMSKLPSNLRSRRTIWGMSAFESRQVFAGRSQISSSAGIKTDLRPAATLTAISTKIGSALEVPEL